MHIRKFDNVEAGHMFTHYQRGCKKYSNSDIDATRTNLNYNLAPDRNQRDYLNSKLDTYNHSTRKDLVVMADWVINPPKDLSPQLYDKFFKLAYDFCVDRYGHQVANLPNPEDICISAYIHLDETTPHMHFAYMPLIPDEDNWRFKAKEVVCRTDMESFHPDLEKYLNENGLRTKVLTGATIRDAYGRAKSVKQLKYETKLKRELDRSIERGGRF